MTESLAHTCRRAPNWAAKEIRKLRELVADLRLNVARADQRATDAEVRAQAAEAELANREAGV